MLSSEVHRVFRPEPGMVAWPSKLILSVNIRYVGCGQATRGHNAKPTEIMIILVGYNFPSAGVFIENSRSHPRGKLHVPAQIKPVCNMIGVIKDLWLCRHDLRPLPLLLQFF